jgi:hypothetical protein
MGLTNTAATIPGMVSPVVVGALTQDGVSHLPLLFKLYFKNNCLSCAHLLGIQSGLNVQ